MSQENVDAVRGAYETFNRTYQAGPEVLDPEIEWHTAEDLPDSAIHRGIEGVNELLAQWTDSFDDFRSDVIEIIDGGEEVVVVVAELHGRPKGSSDEVVLPESYVWRLRDAKAFEVREFRTRAEALEAAGLSR